MNLASIATRAARFWPDRVAVVDHDGVEYTYADIERRSNQLAALLAERGIGSGETVAVLIQNGIAWFDITLGLLKLGAVRSYVNPRHALPEVSYQLHDSCARALIVSPELRAQVDPQSIAGFSAVIELGDDYEQALTRRSPEFAVVDVDVTHPAEIRYTSGTTGRPKGAVNSHGAWHGLSVGYPFHIGLAEDDTFLHVGPMSHISGTFCLPMIAVGGRQIIRRRFEPADVIDAISERGVTATVMVPTMMYLLFEALELEPPGRGANLRTVVYGGAPMSSQRLELGLRLLGPVFLQLYGMSEVLGGMSFLDKRDHVPGDERLGSCGRASLLGEIMIVAEDGKEAKPGEVGEILMRGPTRLLEYWQRPEATAASIDERGWFHSGDMAYSDERGYLYIVDRKSDVIISGGLNVYPAEIEHVLLEHPAVAEVAIISVPDEKWGEAVKAVVHLRIGASLESEELLTWARPQLAGYKMPKSVDFWTEELPKNPSGKIQRRALRQQYWADADRQVG